MKKIVKSVALLAVLSLADAQGHKESPAAGKGGTPNQSPFLPLGLPTGIVRMPLHEITQGCRFYCVAK